MRVVSSPSPAPLAAQSARRRPGRRALGVAVASLVLLSAACSSKDGEATDAAAPAEEVAALATVPTPEPDAAATVPEADTVVAPAPEADATTAPAPEADTTTAPAPEADAAAAAPEADATTAPAPEADATPTAAAADAALAATPAADADAGASAPTADGGPTAALPDAASAPAAVPAAASTPAPTVELSAGYDEFKIDAIAVALSGDGRYLATGDLGGRVSVWDTENKRLLIQDTLPEGNRVHRVAFAAAQPVLVSGAFELPDAPFRFWQMKPAGPRHTLGRERWLALGLDLDAPGAQLLALVDVGRRTLKLVLWGVDGAEERFMGAVVGEQAFITLSGDGRTAALSDAGGFIHVYRGPPWAEVFAKRFDGAAALQRVLVSNDGLELWGTEANHVFRYTLGDPPALAATLDVDEPGAVVRGLERWPGGRAVAVTRPESGGLRLWDATTGRLAVNVTGGCRCESHAVSADGRSFACDCVPDAVVRVWRVPAAP